MDSNRQLRIETERLLIVPMTFEFVSKILEDDITAYEELDVNPIDEWPNPDTKKIMPVIRDKLSSQPGPDGFGTWLFIDKANRTIIGDGGFKGAPDQNCKIDIGYGIIESKRRLGYALEAVSALIKWAFSQSSVKAITADCLKSNAPSRNLLRKIGMCEINQDNELIYFELYSA